MLGLCASGGPTIPALDIPLAPFTLVLSFSIWVAGYQRAILRRSPARARSVTTQLRQAGVAIVWAPACEGRRSHARVGACQFAWRTSEPPDLCYPFFLRVLWLGRAMRVVLLWSKEVPPHLFVVYWYQGAEGDPERFPPTDDLPTSVPCEAHIGCFGQNVFLVGDLNADPLVILSGWTYL